MKVSGLLNFHYLHYAHTDIDRKSIIALMVKVYLNFWLAFMTLWLLRKLKYITLLADKNKICN